MFGHLLSWIIFLPLFSAVLLLAWTSVSQRQSRLLVMLTSVAEVILAALLVVSFESSTGASEYAENFQMIEKLSWFSIELGSFGSFQVNYLIGVDGISLWLVGMSALVLLIGVLSSWHYDHQYRGYFILYLILSSSIYGCFLALDMFLFYVFFELMLLPMFFLIGIWGGENRSYASIKFFIYTLLGSLLILIVMIGLYLSTFDPDTSQGDQLVRSFDMLLMSSQSAFIEGSVLDPSGEVTVWGQTVRGLAFVLLIVGFAIKLPAVPVHTWLPDAHVEAPTAISVILAAILLKVGGYGIIRLGYGIFPEVAMGYGYWIAAFGALSIIYGGLNAIAQRDIKRLVAYSSVSHMGFVLVGLAALNVEGTAGAVFQMISHGLISAGLFLMVGVLYDRTHNREIENFSGLASRMPQFTFVVIVLFFASLGLPGLSGFIGELLVLMGAFGAAVAGTFPVWMAILSVFGIVLSAIYYLWTTQRMFFGKFWVREERWDVKMKDLGKREWLMFLPLIVLIILLGVYPRILMDPMNDTIRLFIEHLSR